MMKTDLNEILARLEDPSDDLPIEIVNSKGESARFAQIALIPMSVDPSDETEDDIICHYFAFVQPINESDEPMGENLIFDLSKNDNGELSIDVVTDQYLITDLFTEFRKLRRAKSVEDEPEVDEFDTEAEIGEAEETDVSNEIEVKEKKKGFFGRLFGKRR